MAKQSPGERLRDYRKAKGLNQEEFGRPVGLTQNNVSRLENDQVAPDLTTALALQNGYGLNPDFWLYGTEPSEVQLVPRGSPEVSDEARILLEFLEKNPDWWKVIYQIIVSSGRETEATIEKLRKIRDELI